MLIKMRTTAASPDLGVLHAEKTYDLPPEDAKPLLDAGCAEPVVRHAKPVPAQRAETPETRGPRAAAETAGRQRRQQPATDE
jgi:hypothetical protein